MPWSAWQGKDDFISYTFLKEVGRGWHSVLLPFWKLHGIALNHTESYLFIDSLE